MAHHGCLIVRGVFDDARVAETVEAIDRTQAAQRSWDAAAPAADAEAWFRPFPTRRKLDAALRERIAEQGGSWLADSPASTARLLDDLDGDRRDRSRYQPPRRAPLLLAAEVDTPADGSAGHCHGWHQDGSFLGPEVRTMNVWLALSRCGGDYPSPGLEIVPKRVPDFLPCGTMTRASIDFAVVEAVAADAAIIRPEFFPGDALLFDEHFLHRTYVTPEMTAVRYAVECWFFAMSHFAGDYVPFLV